MEILFFKIKHLFQTIFNLNVVAISIISFLIIYFIDLPKLKKKGFTRDIKLAKYISIMYLIVPAIIYTILKFI